MAKKSSKTNTAVDNTNITTPNPLAENTHNITEDNLDGVESFNSLFQEPAQSQDLAEVTEAFKLLVSSITEPKLTVDMFTDLTDKEIMIITLLQTFEGYYKLNSLNLLINHLLRLKISKNRLGRAELLSAMDKISNTLSTMSLAQEGLTTPSPNTIVNNNPSVLPPQRKRRFKFW